MAELFKNIELHVICVCETWFKRWHSNKRIGLTGYMVVRADADRRDGKRGGGVAKYIKGTHLQHCPPSSLV
jgi:hypothetical protein